MVRHIGRITVAKASGDKLNFTDVDINGILDRIFAFVLNLMGLKGKGPSPAS